MRKLRTLLLLLIASSMMSLFAIIGIVACIIFAYHVATGR